MEIVIAILFIVLIYFCKLIPYKRYKKFYKYKKQDKVEKSINFMADGDIKVKRIMNKEENQIYYTLLKIFKEDYNINPQVSFKAFLDGEYGSKSWLSFRDFYCDFLLTHKKGEDYHKPAAVIEYHGGGHYGDSEDARKRVEENDYIKNEVLNKAGINLFIIKAGDIKSDPRYVDIKKLEVFLLNIKSKLKQS